MANNDSDPLPYTQVDRAVKPRATLLAGAMQITPQHALGSLIEFWDLCGDPREIERLLADGKSEVILDATEITNRFAIASGKAIQPSVLVSAGLLEPKGGDLFRVRGMSRYFRPIEGRLLARAKASAGGKASAAARKAKYGTAQPPIGRSEPGSSQVRSEFEPGSNYPSNYPSNQRSNPVRTSAEPGPNLSSNPPEAAVSGQRSTPSLKTLADAFASPPWKATQDRICDAFADLRQKPYHWQGVKDSAALKRLLSKESPDEILRRWRYALDAVGWLQCNTVAQLASKWNDLSAIAVLRAVTEPCAHEGCTAAGVRPDGDGGPLVCEAHWYAAEVAFRQGAAR
jgi:hypothetical protein